MEQSINTLNITLSSISSSPSPKKGPAKGSNGVNGILESGISSQLSQGSVARGRGTGAGDVEAHAGHAGAHDAANTDAMPEVDLTKVPMRGAVCEMDVMIVEREGWAGYQLLEQGCWTQHAGKLDVNNCKPGIRIIIAKAETHGPKTTPYTIYVMHIKTAFTIRIISKRYSEFKELDHHLRALFSNAPILPRKKTFGKMSPKFITERKRQLQTYIESLLVDVECSASAPFKAFLSVQGHAAEEMILNRKEDRETPQPLFTPYRLPAGLRVDQVLAVIEQCRQARDVRQEARALGQLALMHSKAGNKAEALEAIRGAFQCCRQIDVLPGLMVCAETWACIHALFGDIDAAEVRFREAAEIAAQHQDSGALGSCCRNLGIISSKKGTPNKAGAEALKAISLFREVGDLQSAALTEFALGNILFAAGEVRQAVNVLEHCLLLRRRCRDKLGLAQALNSLGLAFAQIGYQLHAMDYFDQSLALCQELGDRDGESTCLRHLGRVHHMHGDHNEALSSLEKSLALCVRLDNIQGQAQCHKALADVRLDLGDPRLAIVHLEEALMLLGGSEKAVDKVEDKEEEEEEEEEEVDKEEEEESSVDGATCLLDELRIKLGKARELQMRTMSAYDDLDKISGQARVGAESSKASVTIVGLPPRRDDAANGGEDLVQEVGPIAKAKKPSFPIQFKAKMPGQDLSSHFKFLQSWTVHKKYYKTSEEASPVSTRPAWMNDL